MKNVKIEYYTEYDSTKTVCGYVIGKDQGDYYTINKRQFRRCMDNRRIGGVAGIVFLAEKPVFVSDGDLIL